MKWLTIRASMRMAFWFAERAVARQRAQHFAARLQHWCGSQAEMPPEAAPVLEFLFASHASGTIAAAPCQNSKCDRNMSCGRHWHYALI